MKIKINLHKVTIGAVIAFFIGVFYLLFKLLFVVPKQIFDSIGTSDIRIYDNIFGVLSQFSIMLIAEFLIGVVLIVFLLNQKNKNSESVIYVEKYLDSSKNKTSQEIETQENDKVENIIQRITTEGEANSDKEKLENIFQSLNKELKAGAGAFYLAKETEKKERFIELLLSYAFVMPDSQKIRYEFGEGVAGQAAKSQKVFNINAVPQGYIVVASGLGKTTPSNLVAYPIIKKQQVVAVLEIASFEEFSSKDLEIIKEVCNLVNNQVNFENLQ